MAKYTRHIYTLQEIRDIVAPIAQANGVKKVYLFGTYARGEAIWKSDVGLQIERGKVRTLFALGGLYADLEEGLRKPIDILTDDSMRDGFYENIKNEEVAIYG